MPWKGFLTLCVYTVGINVGWALSTMCSHPLCTVSHCADNLTECRAVIITDSLQGKWGGKQNSMEVACTEAEEDFTDFTHTVRPEGDHIEKEACTEPGKEGKAMLPLAFQRAPFPHVRGSTCPGRKGQALGAGWGCYGREAPLGKASWKVWVGLSKAGLLSQAGGSPGQQCHLASWSWNSCQSPKENSLPRWGQNP